MTYICLYETYDSISSEVTVKNSDTGLTHVPYFPHSHFHGPGAHTRNTYYLETHKVFPNNRFNVEQKIYGIICTSTIRGLHPYLLMDLALKSELVCRHFSVAFFSCRTNTSKYKLLTH